MTKSGKHCDKRRNCTFCAISSFVTMFSKSRLLQRRQKASIWGKGLSSRTSDTHVYRRCVFSGRQLATSEELELKKWFLGRDHITKPWITSEKSLDGLIKRIYLWVRVHETQDMQSTYIHVYAGLRKKSLALRCAPSFLNVKLLSSPRIYYGILRNSRMFFVMLKLPVYCLAHLSFAQGELLWSPFVRRPSCVVRRPSTVVRQLLLLSNQWVNWDETSQKASSQWPHQISFNFLGSMQNSGFHGNEMKKTSKFFFSQTGWQIFK